MGDFKTSNIISWSVQDVVEWFNFNGFTGHDQKIIENEIDGEALSLMKNESLIDLGIPYLGTRLLLLKKIYHIKKAHQVRIDSNSYIPETAVGESLLNNIDIYKKYLEQENIINGLVYEIDKINMKATDIKDSDSKTLNTKSSKNNIKPKKSINALNPKDITITTSKVKSEQTNTKSSPTSDSNTFKSFKIGTDEPCYKVLPHALKKYNIDDDWRNYTLTIRSIKQGKKVEKSLKLDDKPLMIFQQLKEKGEKPVFVLKKNKSANQDKKLQIENISPGP
ncbi:hypothetical protein BB559_000028 [Furculomyces boomerangus]|uniref:SAM domain-containing protein n=1 Tax=Furculomyces boomerangus TaxID=61424 RepID=A0A2T9Z4P4_9FUNG|nr:hypothetical protein BB559_000650 [Furculomyces boomerangus]PVV00219.1 hypothetical protein BB559_000028 [Furculomyces boomerangus]